jgi:predicted ATPase/DNA-binding winged helix-turn-helix (wHTH) protein
MAFLGVPPEQSWENHMKPHGQITFGGFSIDSANELLCRGSERIRLRPKTFALFLMLAERPGQLVTKKELLKAIWKDCYVKDEALKHCVAEIRRTLSDDAANPKFIETVNRRGYCFIGNIEAQNAGKSDRPLISNISRKPSSVGNRPLVGRASELDQLHHWLKTAMEGARQVVFISGDQGIGKTSLVDAFIKIVNSREPKPNGASRARPLIARGQCIKLHGAGEAYMPFMEALTRIGDNSVRKHIIPLLKRYAPLWLSQMPSLASAAKWRNPRHSAMDANHERMMREMAEALEALTFERSMILVLEDLHWSDYSTLDLISYWAHRRGVARLLLIATYRPQDILRNNHPLKTIKEELQAHQQCQELQIPFLVGADICEYLQHCFPGHKFPQKIAAWIRERTGGNPLFMVNILDQLRAQGFLVLRDGHWVLNDTLETAAQFVPQTIQQIIERQLERCTSEEQKLLKAGSVEGVEFSNAGVAAAIGGKRDRIAGSLHSLARRNQFIQAADSVGKQMLCYKFIHTLYQQTFYQLLPEELRMQYHRRIAAYIEKTNDNLEEFASLLAMHFDRSQDRWNALKYYLKAAEKANSRYAGRDALELATRGVQLLLDIPENPERIELEVRLQNSLGTALISARGLGIKEVKLAFHASRNLFRKLSTRRQSARRALLFNALYGLWGYHWIHAEYAAALDLAEQMMQLAEVERNPAMLNQAHYSMGFLLMDHGDFVAALKHLEKNSNVFSRSMAAVTLWNLGYPDRALTNIEQILSHDCETGNRRHRMFARLCITRVHMERRDIAKALDHAKLAFDLAVDQEFGEPWLAHIRSLYGWALAKLGQSEQGMEQIKQALDVVRAFGSSSLKPLLLAILADLSLEAGRIDEGLAAIDEALDSAGSTGMNYMDAELHRFKGELLLRTIIRQNIVDSNGWQMAEVASYFEQAIEIASKQQAKSLELRATISLAKFLRKENRQREAYKRLKRIYSWFTEGLETADLREARELLQELTKYNT